MIVFDPSAPVTISKKEYDSLRAESAWLDVILSSKRKYGSYSSEVIDAVKELRESVNLALSAVERCGWVKEEPSGDPIEQDASAGEENGAC